jgi:4-hydroxy-2-oxoheptanedioate aldolase
MTTNNVSIIRKFLWSSLGAAAVLAVPVVAWLAAPYSAHAQNKHRLNPLIEKLESGGNALTPTDWTFIDLEHGPFSMERLQGILADLDKKRKPSGQLPSAPIVRIPMDGDEDSRWAVKQVLDSGAMGVIFGHVESKEQALAAIQSMRYPPQKGAAHPTPAGKRGYAPQRAVKYWGVPLTEYLHKADVWPLNPDGELFAMIMIETVEGVKHINEILDVPGIGSIFIGASDLGMSLGVGPATPLPPPEAEAEIAKVLSACKAKKVICSFPAIGGPGEVKQRLDAGFRMLLVSGAPQ